MDDGPHAPHVSVEIDAAAVAAFTIPPPPETPIESRLNEEIARMWWKRCIATVFWDNVSTPVNLVITAFTAVTTAQATGGSVLLSQSTYVSLSLVTLIVSTINTFFRPHAQMVENARAMQKWSELGARYEAIHYGDLLGVRRHEACTALFRDVQRLKCAEASSSGTQHCLTDLVHAMLVKKFGARLWIDGDVVVQRELYG